MRSGTSEMTRRSVLVETGRGIIAAAATLGACGPASADFATELMPPLRRLTGARRIRFGCAGAAPNVQSDAALLEKFGSEADIFIPEGCLKWDQTQPRPNEFVFDGPDSIVDFAGRNDMLMHGHTLVWYAALPDWVLQLSSAREATAALEQHIDTLVSRYRGKVWAWDVVNEPIEPADGLENGYRNSIWQRLLGIDHVDLAFRLARAADPKAPLSLNEYGLEYATAVCRRRRAATLALLRRLRDLSTPIECFGLQSHLDASEMLDWGELTDFLREVVRLGYRLMITELDVNDVRIPGSDAERDTVVARHVADYLDLVAAVDRPISVSTWGLSDRYTWMRQYFRRADGRALRPLPLDGNLERKRMWSAIAAHISS